MTHTLNTLIDEKYISVQKHPKAELYIYNYTQKTQFEGLWNEHTLNNRGTIRNGNGEIVHRPFPKFFNLSQVEKLPTTETFEVYEKLDGSLGILYWVDGTPAIATRGSFTSEQAIFATEKLLPKYLEYINAFDRSLTYMFEIIYPTNRIVVDYGKQERLVLLGVNSLTESLSIENVDFPDKAQKINIREIDQLEKSQDKIHEGFVLQYKSGFRVKYKFDEYVRLHRILTSVTARTVWEYMKDQKDLSELYEHVPDEFYQWLKQTRDDIQHDFKRIALDMQDIFDTLDLSMSRKDIAGEIMREHREFSKYLFALLDGKPIDDLIWKDIKPSAEKPFVNEI